MTYSQVTFALDRFYFDRVVSFNDIFEKLKCDKRSRETFKAFLINNNLVYRVESWWDKFGRPYKYSFSSLGGLFFQEVQYFQAFDLILFYMDRSKFYSIREICESSQMTFSELLEIRLKNDGMIELKAESKDGKAYTISEKGREWTLKQGGYRGWLETKIDQSLSGDNPTDLGLIMGEAPKLSINLNDGKKESFFFKHFWPIISGVLIAVLGAVILFFLGIKP